MNPESLNAEVMKYVKDVMKLEKGLPPNGVVPILKEKVEDMRSKVNEYSSIAPLACNGKLTLVFIKPIFYFYGHSVNESNHLPGASRLVATAQHEHVKPFSCLRIITSTRHDNKKAC